MRELGHGLIVVPGKFALAPGRRVIRATAGIEVAAEAASELAPMDNADPELVPPMREAPPETLAIFSPVIDPPRAP